MARRFQYASDMSLIKRDWEDDRLGLVSETLNRYLPTPRMPDLRGFEWYYYSSLLTADATTISLGSSPSQLTRSPDGRFVAVTTGDGVTVFDTKTLKPILNAPGKLSVSSSCVFSGDGSTLFQTDIEWKTDQDGRFVLSKWDLASGEKVADLLTIDDCWVSFPLAIDHLGSRIAVPVLMTRSETGEQWREVQVWDLNTAELIKTHKVSHDLKTGPAAVRFHPNGKAILVGGGTGPDFEPDPESFNLRLVDIASDTLVTSYQGHTGMVNDLEYSPDGRYIISGGFDNTVRIWDAESGKLLRTLSSFDSAILDVAFDASGALIAAASGNSVRIFDTKTGAEVNRLRGRYGAVVFGAEDKQLFSWGMNSTVRVWNLGAGRDRGSKRTELDFAGGPLRSAKFSSGMNHVLGDSASSIGTLIEVSSGKVLYQTEPVDPGHGIFISFDGKLIALGIGKAFGTGFTRVINFTSGEEVITPPFDRIFGFDLTSRRIVGRKEETIRIDEITSSDSLSFPATNRAIANLSTDGRLIAIITEVATPENGTSHRIDVYEVESQSLLFSTEFLGWASFFKLNGSTLAAAFGNTVRVWDLSDRTEGYTIKATGLVRAIAFSPDGRRLLTGDFAGTLKLWDVVSGREVLELNHPEPIMDAGFTPDGQTIRALGREGTVLEWSAVIDAGDHGNLLAK
ncbi:hypothetical protein SH139x_003948 [Planctomycetaceae bacterium SH139]